MKTDICALLVSISVFFITLAEAKQTKEKNCYRLIPPKNGSFQQIDFFEDQAFTKPLELQLRSDGLFDGKKQLCLWSLNGGSGTKPKFSLDGDFAAPILDPTC